MLGYAFRLNVWFIASCSLTLLARRNYENGYAHSRLTAAATRFNADVDVDDATQQVESQTATRTVGTCCLYPSLKQFEFTTGACRPGAIHTHFQRKTCATLKEKCSAANVTTSDCYSLVKDQISNEVSQSEDRSKTCCCKKEKKQSCEYKVAEVDGEDYCCKARDGGCPRFQPLFRHWYWESAHSLCGLPTKPSVAPVSCFTCMKGTGMNSAKQGLCNYGLTHGGTDEIFKRTSSEECHGLYKIDCDANPNCEISTYGECVGLGDEEEDDAKCRKFNTKFLDDRMDSHHGCFAQSVSCP